MEIHSNLLPMVCFNINDNFLLNRLVDDEYISPYIAGHLEVTTEMGPLLFKISSAHIHKDILKLSENVHRRKLVRPPPSPDNIDSPSASDYEDDSYEDKKLKRMSKRANHTRYKSKQFNILEFDKFIVPLLKQYPVMVIHIPSWNLIHLEYFNILLKKIYRNDQGAKLKIVVYGKCSSTGPQNIPSLVMEYILSGNIIGIEIPALKSIKYGNIFELESRAKSVIAYVNLKQVVYLDNDLIDNYRYVINLPRLKLLKQDPKLLRLDSKLHLKVKTSALRYLKVLLSDSQSINNLNTFFQHFECVDKVTEMKICDKESEKQLQVEEGNEFNLSVFLDKFKSLKRLTIKSKYIQFQVDKSKITVSKLEELNIIDSPFEDYDCLNHIKLPRLRMLKLINVDELCTLGFLRNSTQSLEYLTLRNCSSLYGLEDLEMNRLKALAIQCPDFTRHRPNFYLRRLMMNKLGYLELDMSVKEMDLNEIIVPNLRTLKYQCFQSGILSCSPLRFSSDINDINMVLYSPNIKDVTISLNSDEQIEKMSRRLNPELKSFTHLTINSPARQFESTEGFAIIKERLERNGKHLQMFLLKTKSDDYRHNFPVRKS